MYLFTDNILKGFDEGLVTGMILIELQKVFETIDHEILLQKFKAIRFSKEIYSGLDTIFLSEYFLLTLKLSSQILEKNSCVVPQGSNLGPLF